MSMTREQLIVDHWYEGKTGQRRQILAINGFDIFYYRECDDSTSIPPRNCWMTTFEGWAVRDLGTELPADERGVK